MTMIRAITNSTICSYYQYIFFNVIIIWIIPCFWKEFLCECIFNVILQDLCLYFFLMSFESFIFHWSVLICKLHIHVHCIYIAYYIAYNFIQFVGPFPCCFYTLVYQNYFSINTQGSEFESVHVKTFYTFSICFVWIV